LFRDFGELILYLGLYIKMEPFSSIPQHLGFPVLLDVLGVALPVPLQITRVLLDPLFDPGVVVATAIGVFLPPPGIVLCFEGFFTGRIPAGLLPLSYFRVKDKGGSAIRTLFSFHLGLPLG
jgi:hypothetical protein